MNFRSPGTSLPKCIVASRTGRLQSPRWYGILPCTPAFRFPTELMSQPHAPSSLGAAASRTDPVLRAAWREALVVFTLWGAALIWSVGYCALYAYPPKDQLAEAAAKLTFTLGFPTWVFWGIVVPWVLCAILSFVISRFVICDADLGIDPDEALKEIIDG